MALTLLAFAAGAAISWLLVGGAAKIRDQAAVVFARLEIGKTPPPTRDAARARTSAAANASMFFIGLKDGDTLPSKATIKFGLSGMEIAPAGTEMPGSGHVHLLIDSPLPAFDQEIPNDLNHLHFDKGQTEANIELSAGDHTLQPLLSDHLHVPHDPPVMSEVIHVRVLETSQVNTNVPFVEALRLDSPMGIGVILLNWKGWQVGQSPLPVTVFVAGAAGKSAMSVAGAPIVTQTVGPDLNVTLSMKSVDILMVR